MDEPPTNTETPVDEPKDEPEIPLTPTCEEPPEIPTNPESNKAPKVARRASAAIDKTQKRARRLSVPGNFLSFLTRRKSGVWSEDMRNLENQERKESVVSHCEGESQTSALEEKETENMEKPEEPKDGPDQSPDKPDEETEQKPVPESDMECKDTEANSHKDEETQQEENLSEKETLQDTELKNSPNDDQSKDEKTFFQYLPVPVEKDDKLGVANLQNILIGTLNLETLHLHQKPESKERSLHDYLDLAGHETVSSTVELIRKPVVEVCVPASVGDTSEERKEGVIQEDSREDGERQIEAKDGMEEMIAEDGGDDKEEVCVREEITEDTGKDQHSENAEKPAPINDLTDEETMLAQNKQESEQKKESEQDEPSEEEPKKEEVPAENESSHEKTPDKIQSPGNRDMDNDGTTDQSEEPKNLTETDSQKESLPNDTSATSELQTDRPTSSETPTEEVSLEKTNCVSLDNKDTKSSKQVSFAHSKVELTEKSHSILNGNSNTEATHAESNGSLHHNDESQKTEAVSQ